MPKNLCQTLSNACASAEGRRYLMFLNEFTVRRKKRRCTEQATAPLFVAKPTLIGPGQASPATTVPLCRCSLIHEAGTGLLYR